MKVHRFKIGIATARCTGAIVAQMLLRYVSRILLEQCLGPVLVVSGQRTSENPCLRGIGLQSPLERSRATEDIGPTFQ